jgi:hypothetical protein
VLVLGRPVDSKVEDARSLRVPRKSQRKQPGVYADDKIGWMMKRRKRDS